MKALRWWWVSKWFLPRFRLAAGALRMASAMRRLKRSTMPLVCGWKGLVRRCSMPLRAQQVSNGCLPEGFASGLPFISTAKRSVNSLPLSVRMVWTGWPKAAREALEAGRDGLAVAAGDDLDMNEARGAFDGDEDIGLHLPEAGQMLEVDMHEAEGVRIKH